MSKLILQARKFHISQGQACTTERLVHALADQIEELEATLKEREDLIFRLVSEKAEREGAHRI